MTFDGTLRWIGPPPAGIDTLAEGRVWRWTAAEAPPPHASDALRAAPPGFAEPGFALFDAHDRPLLALGRHLRRLADGATHAQAILAPAAPNAWSQLGLATHALTGFVAHSPDGALRARLTRPDGFHDTLVDPRDRLVVDGATVRLEKHVAGRGGLLGALMGHGCTGVRFVDDASGARVGECVAEGIRAWRGEVTVPVRVHWAGNADPWPLAALALVVTTVIDRSDDRGA
jgi:hypothetical protein